MKTILTMKTIMVAVFAFAFVSVAAMSTAHSAERVALAAGAPQTPARVLKDKCPKGKAGRKCRKARRCAKHPEKCAKAPRCSCACIDGTVCRTATGETSCKSWKNAQHCGETSTTTPTP